MAFSANELTNIANSTLENFLDKGKVWKQNVQNKPMLEAFNAKAGKFAGGNQYVSVGIKSGQGGGTLTGYTHDDQVTYYNPANNLRAKYPWREHHIGIVVTHTELKIDGIDIVGDDPAQGTREMNGREENALANLFDEKLDELGEDYAISLDKLIHRDGTGDAKALAGVKSLLVANPLAGTVGGLSRATYAWWRNDAATAAFATGGGAYGAITSSSTGGGALISFMDKAMRRRNKHKNGATDVRYFCGSDFIDAYKAEMRSNGWYTESGWKGVKPDGSMQDPSHAGIDLVYDPTMDDEGESKRCYAIDMGRQGIRLMYMDGQRMKKHEPARPYDRYVLYQGITTTAVLVARQLNTSGVYDIA